MIGGLDHDPWQKALQIARADAERVEFFIPHFFVWGNRFMDAFGGAVCPLHNG